MSAPGSMRTPELAAEAVTPQTLTPEAVKSEPGSAAAPARRAAIGPRPSAQALTQWVHQTEGEAGRSELIPTSVYTARLTIDVTPALRARIKVTAFERGMTAAQLLREILQREFEENHHER